MYYSRCDFRLYTLQALVRERIKDWGRGLCAALGKRLVELTGEITRSEDQHLYAPAPASRVPWLMGQSGSLSLPTDLAKALR